MVPWDVFEISPVGQRCIDTVYYNEGISAKEVYSGLVNHDGYPSSIVVRNNNLRKAIEMYGSVNEFVYQNNLDYDDVMANYVHPEDRLLWD